MSMLSGRTWREFGYLWAILLLAGPAFAYVVLVPSLAAGLLITVVGLLPVGWLVVGARGWGVLYRSLGAELLGQQLLAPSRRVRAGAFWRILGSSVTDAVGWRALLFMFLTVPLGIGAAVVSTTVLVSGLGAVTHVVWSHLLPPNTASDGSVHYGVEFNDWFIDTPARNGALAAVGLMVLLLWPLINHLLVLPFRFLARALLQRTSRDRRERRLRRERDQVVEDAAARLRRIERDLHDGTQARLVSVAMQLGEAREQISSGGDPALVARLLEGAHESTKSTMAELRDITGGIHPAALDAGLAAAIHALTTRSVVPVELNCEDDFAGADRLTPAAQAITYFSVAELLTNTAKHASATRADVCMRTVTRNGAPHLQVQVRDDGQGGARITRTGGTAQTGLAGVEDRLAAIDGTLDINSPDGGPTTITMTLPHTHGHA